MRVLKGKASTAELDNLHNKVAEALGNNLDDSKVLAQAITFLKNNNITAAPIESNKLVSLTDSIKAIANKDTDKDKTLSVEDMLAIAER